MAPAQQRLGRGDLAAAQVVFRLVREEEFAAREAEHHRAHQRQGRGRIAIGVAIEGGGAQALGARLLDGDFGAFEQGEPSVGVVGIAGKASRDRDVDAILAEAQRLGDEVGDGGDRAAAPRPCFRRGRRRRWSRSTCGRRTVSPKEQEMRAAISAMRRADRAWPMAPRTCWKRSTPMAAPKMWRGSAAARISVRRSCSARRFGQAGLVVVQRKMDDALFARRDLAGHGLKLAASSAISLRPVTCTSASSPRARREAAARRRGDRTGDAARDEPASGDQRQQADQADQQDRRQHRRGSAPGSPSSEYSSSSAARDARRRSCRASSRRRSTGSPGC